MMISSYSSCHPGAIFTFLPVIHGAIHPFLHSILVQNSQRVKELNKFCPPNSSDDLCLFFCINPSSSTANTQRNLPRVHPIRVLNIGAPWFHHPLTPAHEKFVDFREIFIGWFSWYTLSSELFEFLRYLYPFQRYEKFSFFWFFLLCVFI